MFYIVFNFAMAVIMFLFGIWFYRSKGQASKFLSGYNMKSAEERKKYDENAMCKVYGKRMIFMSIPFIAGMIIGIWYPEIGCLIAWAIWFVMFIQLRRWTKGYRIKQPNMDCQPTEITALMRHRAVFS